MSLNLPGGVNLTLAIITLVGAALSIGGFIAYYIPNHQYGDFCNILDNINNIFAVDDWKLSLPSDQRSTVLHRYCRHVYMHCLGLSCIG
jgi:hypothetical protein